MDRNKLGFYIQVSQGVHDHITAIKPPVILIHAWDQGLLEEIRRFRAPGAFVIGRMDYVRIDGKQVPVADLVQGWLTQGDPEAHGRGFAEHILEDNFQLARRAEGGRLLVDAWMSLNECVPGPGSGAYRNGTAKERAEIEGKLRTYDRFQFGFRNKLMEYGIEAVAFNFGAGNFGTAKHYADFFPLTLSSYTYLGFHEYGWPALTKAVDSDAESSAGTYRPIVKGLRQQMGRDYRAIITEAGLARLYRHPEDAAAGDVGWLYPGETISQEKYRRSLEWYNSQLNQDDFALGACLYQVGHEGKWATFRHIGQDNDGRPIEILPWIEGLAAAGRGALTRGAEAHMGDAVGLDANRPLQDGGYLAEQVADPKLIASSGVGWVRLNFVLGPWKSVTDQERHAGRTWEETYRILIDGFRREGLKIYGLISNEAVKVDGQDIMQIFREAPPADAISHPWIDRYVETFVHILRTFRDSLSVVESFNEPDDWKGQQRNIVHAGWFAIMLERIYHEVRKYPDFAHIKLVSGPVQGTTDNQNGSASAKGYLRDVYAFGRDKLDWGKGNKPFPFDGIGYHMYVEENLDREQEAHWKAIRETYGKYLGQMRDTIRACGDVPSRPLYVSEMGWYTNKGPEDRQAECLPFALELLITGPWNVNLAVIFCTQDWGPRETDQPKWYGLYRPGPLGESGRKPAHKAVRLFCRRARDGGGPTPDGTLPAGVRNQDVINAFAGIINAYGLTGWTLMEQNGISLSVLVSDRAGPYRGPDLATLPNLTAEQRSMLLAELASAAAAPRGAAAGFLIGLPDLTTGIETLPHEFDLSLSDTHGAVEQRVMRTWNRWSGLLGAIASELHLDLAAATGVLALSAHHPASNRNGRLRIRFDVQNFLSRSQTAQDEVAGHLRTDPARPWQGQFWRADVNTAWRKVHTHQDEEWGAFRLALRLDPDAACDATGMGIAGIMGFNHELLGYASAEQMLLSLASSERMQVLGLFDFIATPGRNSQALWALRRGDLETFAALHAGPEAAARYAAELAPAIAFFRRVDPLTTR